MSSIWNFKLILLTLFILLTVTLPVAAGTSLNSITYPWTCYNDENGNRIILNNDISVPPGIPGGLIARENTLDPLNIPWDYTAQSMILSQKVIQGVEIVGLYGHGLDKYNVFIDNKETTKKTLVIYSPTNKEWTSVNIQPGQQEVIFYVHGRDNNVTIIYDGMLPPTIINFEGIYNTVTIEKSKIPAYFQTIGPQIQKFLTI